MKNLGTLKAIFLPETVRKILHVNDTESVDIVVEDVQVILKNRIQNALSEIGEILNSQSTDILTDEEAIELVNKFRHGKLNEFEQITQNIDHNLLETEQLAENTDERLSAEDVFNNARKIINEN